MKILLIEDDPNITSLLKRGLSELDHIIECSSDGEEGEYLATINSYDIIILDWMLPSKDGIDILKSLRNKAILTPILMLTAKGDSEDIIKGLETGSDDYISKPFNFDELKARIESLYRRNSYRYKKLITINDITIDTANKKVFKKDKEITLSAKEYQLLILLVENINTFITKNSIENNLWLNEDILNSNVIEVTIYNLRKKLGKDIIKNFRGLGYKIEN